jgi:hypothetical protein
MGASTNTISFTTTNPPSTAGTVSLAGEAPVEVSTQQSNEKPTFVTPEQLRQMKAAEKHRRSVLKKREQRWASPAANAKVEDIMLIAQDMKSIMGSIDALNREIYFIRTALYNAGLINEAQITAIRERHAEREAKFKELQADTQMSNEEKIVIANEYELPLHLLGLQETETTSPSGDVE